MAATRLPPIRVVCVVVIAAALFAPVFATGGIGRVNFWWWMAANSALVLSVIGAWDPDYRALLAADLRLDLARKIGLGVASAAALYGIFFLANRVARAVVPGAAAGIAAVYAFRQGASALRVAILLGLLIGPGEELLWRGFLQRHVALRLGPWGSVMVATALYTLVHVGSGNLMLLLAAVACGLYWGLLFAWQRSFVVNVVSHTVWDLTVFLLAPLY